MDSNSKSEEAGENPAVWSLPLRLSTPLELAHLTVSMDVEHPGVNVVGPPMLPTESGLIRHF